MIKDFHRRVVHDKIERNRLALVGDAFLKYEAVTLIAAAYPDAPAGAIHKLIQCLQENRFMHDYLLVKEVVVPDNLYGKEIADYFEAWIGYMHEKNPDMATDFCYAYVKSLVNPEFTLNIEDFTKDLINNQAEIVDHD